MFNITEPAAIKAKELIEKNRQQSPDPLRLKLIVENAGCAGEKYGLQLTNTLNKRDIVHKRFGIEIIIPEDYYQYFENATVELEENKFKINIDNKEEPQKTI